MRLLSTIFFLTFLSTTTNALPNNYVEFGLGATQFELAKNLNTSNSSVTPSPSGKILIGGRLNKSPHFWFETAYQYNGSFNNTSNDTRLTQNIKNDTVYKSHSVTFGLKLTTLPYENFATYARFGAGINKVFMTTDTLTTDTATSSTTRDSSSENKSNTTYYGGGGFSFAVNKRSHLNFEYQLINYTIDDTNLSDHVAFMTYKIFIR